MKSYYLAKIVFYKTGRFSEVSNIIELIQRNDLSWQSFNGQHVFNTITPGFTSPNLSEQERMNNVKSVLHFISENPTEVHYFINGAKAMKNFNVPWRL